MVPTAQMTILLIGSGGDPVECSDELEAEARRVAERLEAEFDGKLLAELVNSGGRAG